ncbi:MAG: hypothetical protein KDK07_12035 [Bauldia sp.]|nr:hypothetical protein [Bauldia sp.]
MKSLDELVLCGLAEARSRFEAGAGPEFVRPVDLGNGRDGLHLAALNRLVAQGFAVTRPRQVPFRTLPPGARREFEILAGCAPPVAMPSRVREYAITAAGMAAFLMSKKETLR